ncbi:hypothetical protein N658DRAFT_270020 [Parathielavia hyrcaniae]|uniref:Uncharacterized protein n=1 Tax=Parathielavia hyrcaniae TaxID=113614 RepID=A0AAN6SXN2_9PEZI|nr:hypothetical protein N658DRAFT_270020 [Parathielavia hyrcaniae]
MRFGEAKGFTTSAQAIVSTVLLAPRAPSSTQCSPCYKSRALRASRMPRCARCLGAHSISAFFLLVCLAGSNDWPGASPTPRMWSSAPATCCWLIRDTMGATNAPIGPRSNGSGPRSQRSPRR